MRVAIVAESFLPNMNGVTNSVLRVLEHLERTGHDAMVFAPDNPSGSPRAATLHGRIPIHRVPAVMVPRVSSLPVGVPGPSLTAALRGFGPDIVHLASPFVLGAGGMVAATRLGVPSVAVYQTDVAGFAESYGLGLTSKAVWRWTRRVHRGAARTLAPSSSAVQALEQHGVPRVYRWARGVDAVRFAPSARREASRREWAPSGELIVGFVGRLAPEKHLERLASLSESTQLVIVGDGPERGALEKLMPSAIFTGQLGGEELAQAFASFDIFVHPGEHETFCQAVQEALASGIPVIGPDAGGPRDLITHCRNGYLLPVDRFAELLSSAVSALASPKMRARFGEAARRSVLHRTWPVICEELLGHYYEVLGQENRAALRTA